MREYLPYLLGGLYPHFHPTRVRRSVRDRDTRSPELVEYLKDKAEAKRQRRRERNLRNKGRSL